VLIDIHTHILPERFPAWAQRFGYGGFVSLDHHCPGCARMMVDDRFFREVQDNCWDPEVRLRECAVHGVHRQVLSTVPVLFYYWAKAQDNLQIARVLNDHMAEVVARYPDRFYGLGTVPLQDPQLAIEELERFASLGLVGVEIGSHVNDWNLDAPELFPFFEACARLNLSVFVHPWDMMAKEKMSKYWLPWLVGMPAESSLALCSLIFGGVLERLPQLRVAIAHGGGSFPFTLGRIQHGFDVRPDLVAVDNNVPPRDYVGKFWVDSLVHDPRMLQYLVDLFGANRVAVGSDYPFPLGEHHPGALVESMNWDASTKALVQSGAALEWLGLSGI
jgi:aminocarboxymuconate-semialdehyde decarboxylase